MPAGTGPRPHAIGACEPRYVAAQRPGAEPAELAEEAEHGGLAVVVAAQALVAAARRAVPGDVVRQHLVERRDVPAFDGLVAAPDQLRHRLSCDVVDLGVHAVLFRYLSSLKTPLSRRVVRLAILGDLVIGDS